jgi:hypothetical protein
MRLKADAAYDVVQARLVLKYLQLRATFGWSFSNLVALVRMNLFASRDLWTWLADPFTPPPLPPEPGADGAGLCVIRTASEMSSRTRTISRADPQPWC